MQFTATPGDDDLGIRRHDGASSASSWSSDQEFGRVHREANFLNMRDVFHAIEPHLLGKPGFDNALYLKINTGKAVHRVLFDCGADCLSTLAPSEVQKIDAIFFSHLHFDHVAGFDYFLRFNFDRDAKPVQIFGPPRTAEILHHRLQGVMWDRVAGSAGEFVISEIHGSELRTYKMCSSDGFRSREFMSGSSREKAAVLDLPEFSVHGITLDHGTPSIGYLLETRASQSVDTGKLAALNLKPGGWIRDLKDPSVHADTEMTVNGRVLTVGELRAELLVTKSAERIGYLTDFRFSQQELSQIAALFSECDVLVCENNYRDEHQELARKNYHVTSSEVAQIADAVKPKNLVLFHLSDRYERSEWITQLSEVRSLFGSSYLPAEWRESLGREGAL